MPGRARRFANRVLPFIWAGVIAWLVYFAWTATGYLRLAGDPCIERMEEGDIIDVGVEYVCEDGEMRRLPGL